jgi:hypothetical protein
LQALASWVYSSLLRGPNLHSRFLPHRVCVVGRGRVLCLRLDHDVGRGRDPHRLDHPWSYDGFDRLGLLAHDHHFRLLCKILV